MLKRIRKHQACIGMYIQSIDGPWLSHPFFRARFVLSDQKDLDKLLASDIETLLIDTAKGRDLLVAVEEVATPEPRVGTPRSHPQEPPCPAPPDLPVLCPGNGEADNGEQLRDLADTLSADLDDARVAVAFSREILQSFEHQARLGKITEKGELLVLVDRIAGLLESSPHAFVNVTRLKTLDDFSYLHALSVAALMMNLATELGLVPEQVREAGLAGLLHDMGKLKLPAELLDKANALDPKAVTAVRQHTALGVALLCDAFADLPAVLDACLHHHERVDGSGFPNGLTGQELSLFAKMVGICDVYDAMTSDRPHKPAWGPTATLQRMFAWKGQFDQPLLSAFIRSVGIYPVGSLVRMESGRLGVVMAVHSRNLTKPILRIFYSTSDEGFIPPIDIDLSLDEHSDHIVSAENPDEWGFPEWNINWQQLLERPDGRIVAAATQRQHRERRTIAAL